MGVRGTSSNSKLNWNGNLMKSNDMVLDTSRDWKQYLGKDNTNAGQFSMVGDKSTQSYLKDYWTSKDPNTGLALSTTKPDLTGTNYNSDLNTLLTQDKAYQDALPKSELPNAVSPVIDNVSNAVTTSPEFTYYGTIDGVKALGGESALSKFDPGSIYGAEEMGGKLYGSRTAASDSKGFLGVGNEGWGNILKGGGLALAFAGYQDQKKTNKLAREGMRQDIDNAKTEADALAKYRAAYSA